MNIPFKTTGGHMSEESSQENIDKKSKAISNFTEKMTERMFDRIVRGQIDYTKDLRELEKYREQARQIGDLSLEGNIVNTTAVLESLTGHIQKGYLLFQELYDIAEKQSDLRGMTLAFMNQGINLLDQAKYTDALAKYDAALQLIEQDRKDPGDLMDRYGALLSCRVQVLVLLREFDAATTVFEACQAVAESFVEANKETYAAAMADAYHGMVEVYREAQNFEKAHSHWRLALSLADGLDLPHSRLESTLASVRLALAQEDTDRAASYLEQTQAIIDAWENDPHKGRAVISEARKMAILGFPQHALSLAQQALAIFRKYEMSEDITLAQSFISSLKDQTDN
jgi:tetratricopeptide (TPR) repeat protein